MKCIYAHCSEECYVIDGAGRESRIEETQPTLCAWAESAPIQLVDVPRWLQRNALAGHLLRYPTDCEGCPCFTPRDGANCVD